MVNRAARALGKLAAGKPKNFSAAERKRRADRLAAARAKRWPRKSNKVVRGAEPSAGPRTSPPTGSDFCVWKPDNDGNWETTCGQMHVFFDGTPHQNNYRFCPYCGKKLSQTEGEDNE